MNFRAVKCRITEALIRLSSLLLSFPEKDASRGYRAPLILCGASIISLSLLFEVEYALPKLGGGSYLLH
jgi:hypothetical protein